MYLECIDLKLTSYIVYHICLFRGKFKRFKRSKDKNTSCYWYSSKFPLIAHMVIWTYKDASRWTWILSYIMKVIGFRKMNKLPYANITMF